MGTKLIVYDEKSTPTLSGINDGLQGNYDIVHRMVELVRNTTVFDKGFEVYVKQMLAQQGMDSHSNPEAILNWVYEFVRSNVAYILDPSGQAEFLTSPRRTLSNGFGDCDDQSVLVASMLCSLGFHDIRFCLVRWKPTEETYSHVYTVCYVDGERFALDTCLREGKFNEEKPHVASKEFSIWGYNPAVDNPVGVVRNLLGTMKDLSKEAVTSAPTLMSFLPTGLGYVARNALSASVSMLSGLPEEKQNYTFAEQASVSGKQLDSLLEKLANQKITVEQAKSYAPKWLKRLQDTSREGMSEEDAELVFQNVKNKHDLIMNFNKSVFGVEPINLDKKKMMMAGIAVITATALFMMSRGDDKGEN